MSKQLPRGLVLDRGEYRILFVSKSQPGRRYRERLVAGTTRRAAESYLAKLREDDRMGELVWPGDRQPAQRPERVCVGTYRDEIYLPYCAVRNAPTTMAYKINCLTYSAPWFAHLPLDSIDLKLAYQFQAERKSEGVRAATVNREWAVMRHLLHHAHSTGARAHPPPRVAKLPETDSRETRALDVEEATRALQYAHDRGHIWYAVALTLLHTGARWSDVRGLRWEDVDLDGAVVRYRAATAKQNRDREVPLVPEVVAALRQLPQESAGVFDRQHHTIGRWIPLHHRAKMGNSYPWEGPDGDCHFGAHTWRHTFASWKLRAGIPIAVVSRWLGHASIQLTVDRYGHIEPRDHRDEIMRGPRPQARHLRVVGEE